METGPTTPDTADPAGALTLAPKLDLRASTELSLELAARRGADLVLDGANVEHLGAHALQTLVAAAKAWEADGRTFTIASLTDAAQADLATLGAPDDILQTGGSA
ncbi:MAG: STAS domain-containing protein [Pseudomonadota bacterium]